MRKALSLVAAVAFLVSAAGGPAEGHVKTFKTDVSIASVPLGPGTAFGYVFAGPSACDVGRVVTLYLGSTPVGTATSVPQDEYGRWEISETFGGSTYYASVSKITFKKNRRHRHRCGADVSDGYANL